MLALVTTPAASNAVEGTIAIVIASGAGVRIGGPKALLVAAPHEEPLVVAQCRDRLENESIRAIAVVRSDVAEIVEPLLVALGAEVVVSRAPDAEGPAGSIAAAAAHLADTAFRAALVTPVDVRVRPETVRALVSALVSPVHEPLMEAPPGHHEPLIEAPPGLREPRIEAVVPRFAGRRGHPVVLGPAALARYRDGAPPPLRDHLRALGDRAITLDVDDPWISEDLDFAHQRETLLRFTGRARPRFFP